jgi:hypothetical protein
MHEGCETFTEVLGNLSCVMFLDMASNGPVLQHQKGEASEK